MKFCQKIFLAISLCFLFTVAPNHSQAQIIDAILEAIKAAIKAADVAVQKVQNATIDLQNVQKEVENELSKLKLDEIGNWTQKQKDLYGEYFDELWKVKSVITYFKDITDIINKQKQLAAEYKQAYALVQQDSHFSANELAYIYNVYSGIIDASVKSVDQIVLILKSFSVQMSDGERLKILHRASEEIEEQISDLRRFNNQNLQLSLQRAKDQADLSSIRKLYGLPN